MDRLVEVKGEDGETVERASRRLRERRLHDLRYTHGIFRVFFQKVCFFWTWIQLTFSTDFDGYKLPLHPLVSKQTPLVLAALGLS